MCIASVNVTMLKKVNISTWHNCLLTRCCCADRCTRINVFISTILDFTYYWSCFWRLWTQASDDRYFSNNSCCHYKCDFMSLHAAVFAAMSWNDFMSLHAAVSAAMSENDFTSRHTAVSAARSENDFMSLHVAVSVTMSENLQKVAYFTCLFCSLWACLSLMLATVTSRHNNQRLPSVDNLTDVMHVVSLSTLS